MKSGVYEIIHRESGKRYIGSSVDLRNRKRQHLQSLYAGSHHNQYLQNAWNKYGRRAFRFKVLLVCSREDTITYEQIFLDYYKPAYNVSPTAYARTGPLPEWAKQAMAVSARQRVLQNQQEHTRKTKLAHARNRELREDPQWLAWWSDQRMAGIEARAVKHTFQGETLTSQQWADRIGITRSTFDHRVEHWGLEAAVTTPASGSFAEAVRLRSVRSGSPLYDYQGERLTVGEVATRLGIARATLAYRLRRHSFEDAVSHFEAEAAKGPAGKRDRVFVTVGEETHSLADWAKVLGIGRSALYVRSSKTDPQTAVDYYVRKQRPQAA